MVCLYPKSIQWRNIMNGAWAINMQNFIKLYGCVVAYVFKKLHYNYSM